MTHKYLGPDDATTTFDNVAGDTAETRIPVTTQPAATVAFFSNMSTKLTAIAASVAGTLTVGLPSGAATSAKQDTGNTSLGSILSGLASLATSALQTAGNGTLASILAALAPSAAVCDQVSSTNSSAAFGSQVCGLGAWIKNISTGSQIAYIKPGATASASNGYQLAPGEERFFPCSNMNTIRHFSSASGANLCFEAI